MGSEYIHETTVHLKESYKESTAQTPLILIHSYGERSGQWSNGAVPNNTQTGGGGPHL